MSTTQPITRGALKECKEERESLCCKPELWGLREMDIEEAEGVY